MISSPDVYRLFENKFVQEKFEIHFWNILIW